MKLVLATNQSKKFVDFYEDLRKQSGAEIEYASYRDLLFAFDNASDTPVRVINTVTNADLSRYEGVYVNGYLNAYELAAAVAVCCEFLNVPLVNSEMRGAPSLSKLTAYAKLVANGVTIPKTYAGTKRALAAASQLVAADLFPAILKRADADRGIDNFKVTDYAHALQLLEAYDDKSLWILQEFIENDGFYLVSFYDKQPKFSIFRSLEKRPDNNELKSHMYKPKGGENASLIDLNELPGSILEVCTKAIHAVNREIGSVDCLYDRRSDTVYVLEVNYNPQLVTIETFKQVRVDAFLEFMKSSWK